MDTLERRRSRIEDAAPVAPAAPASKNMPRRRREDKVAAWLLEQARSEAEKRGYDAGHASGLETGYAEGEARIRAESQTRLDDELATSLARADQLVETFSKATADLDDHIAYRLAELAIEVGRRLAGHALDLAPEHILDDIEDLLEHYPGLTGSPILYVAAEDAQLVEKHLGQSLASAGWRLHTDTALGAGDCRLEDDEHAIDSIDAGRWSRLLQTVGHEKH